MTIEGLKNDFSHYWDIISSKETRYYLHKRINGTAYDVVCKVRPILESGKMVEQNDIWPFPHNKNEKNAAVLLVNCINASSKKNLTLQSEFTLKILDTMKLKKKSYTQEFFYLVERVLSALGDFENAYNVRALSDERLLECYKNLNKIPRRFYMHMFWALNSTKSCEKVIKLCQSVNQHSRLSIREKAEKFFFFTKHIPKLSKEISFSKEDSDYEHLIRGKKVAIIGPAPGEIDEKQIRKMFDIIIYISYRQNASEQKAPDVSYYNVATAKKLDLLEEKEFLEHLKFSCYKWIAFDYQIELTKKSKARQAFNSDGLLVNGSPNMIQLILYDLLHFSPAYIKIFNVNFYLSKNYWNEKYKTGIEPKTNYGMWTAFSCHNIFDQFLFTKEMYRSGCVDFDEMGQKVLSLELQQYAEYFTLLHGVKIGVNQ